MLDYTSAEKAVIDSNLHVGDNRPLAEVTVSGAPGGLYDLADIGAAYTPHTGYSDAHPSCVELDDGRVLYMYTRDTTLYQAYVSSVDALISGNGTITSETAVLTGLTYARATVFKTPAGALHFIVHYQRSTAESVAKSLLYKSNAGDGSDWALVTTIQSVAWSGSTFDITTRSSVSAPLFKDGYWLVSVPYFSLYGGNLVSDFTIWMVTGDGATWTRKLALNWTGWNSSSWNSSRSLGEIGGDIWFCLADSYGGFYNRFYKSSDGGYTWSEAFSRNASATFYGTLFSDAEYMYLIADDSGIAAPSAAYRVSFSPTAFTDFTNLNLSIPLVSSSLFVAKLGDTLVLTSPGTKVAGLAVPLARLPIKSIDIEPAKNGAGQMTVVIDNKNGVYSPDRSGDWQHVLWPNSIMTAKLGYGENREPVFYGLIDTIRMKTFPQEITVECRDKLKRALDQTVTNDAGLRSIVYTGCTLTEIFSNLAYRAGWALGDIYCDACTTIVTITFTHVSYADAMQQLCELYNWEFYAGRSGQIYFRYVTDRQPEVVDETKTLTGTTAVSLFKYPVVTASIRVRSAASGGGTLYSSATDYIVVEGDKDTAWTIARRTGSTIPDGATVYISYVYAAWVFIEGKNVISLDYTIDDKDIYSKATVIGKTATDAICHGTSEYANASYWNTLTDKVLIINDDTATSAAACEVVAARSVVSYAASARKVTIEAVAVPYLWVGDCIMIVESSTTISEIYRITSIRHRYSGKGWTMTVEAKYYGYAPA